LKSLLKEPLLHFLAIGAALFLVFHFSGSGAGPGSQRIVISSGQIEHLAAGYTKAWQRPPTEAELKGLVDDWVREEIAVREAMATGLDRDDTVIRRRLRQKLEFLVEDSVEAAAPTDAELQAWLAAHAERFRTEPRVAFCQVFISRDRRGTAAEADAAAMRAQLAKAGAAGGCEALGDPTMLPHEIALSAPRDIDRLFGPGFAQQIDAVAPGTWAGPLKSSYGLHLVTVRERSEGALPELARVRAQVEREFLAERRQRQLAAMYERLLAKFTVVVEPARAGPAADRARQGGS
jgi:hypothetical protein